MFEGRQSYLFAGSCHNVMQADKLHLAIKSAACHSSDEDLRLYRKLRAQQPKQLGDSKS